MSATAAAAEFRAAYGDDLDACFSKKSIRVGVAVVGDDNTWLQGDHIIAIIPLFPFGLVGVTSGLHDAELCHTSASATTSRMCLSSFLIRSPPGLSVACML